jgi:hypothetical protein
MNRNELITTVGLAVVMIAMVTSNPLSLSLYASSNLEDDGYTYPDDASEDEKEEIDEREQEAWEDAGRPGERDDDNDDDDENDNNDDADNDNNVIPRPSELPAIANAPGLEFQSTAVNETRWYNNCVGGGKQAGGGLQFDTLDYQNCGINANGDKGYYDGFVEGCMGIDSTNTKELCDAFIVGCLRVTSVDSSETCDVNMDKTSSPWKLVMASPS